MSARREERRDGTVDPRGPQEGRAEQGVARCGGGGERAWAGAQRGVLVHSSGLAPASKRWVRCTQLATYTMLRCASVRLRSRGLIATFLLRFRKGFAQRQLTSLFGPLPAIPAERPSPVITRGAALAFRKRQCENTL
jgi:hypothetical protein